MSELDSMQWRVTVRYLDEYDDPQDHTLTGVGGLVYDDMAAEPFLVRRLGLKGLAIKPDVGSDRVSRSGVFIPPHRIVCIWFEDNLT